MRSILQSAIAYCGNDLKRYVKRKCVDNPESTPILLQQASIDTSVVPQQLTPSFELKSNDSIRRASKNHAEIDGNKSAQSLSQSSLFSLLSLW